MILSFHPLIEKDVNRLCAGRLPNEDDREAIKIAQAVILPQGCSHALYEMARDNCPLVFPNYDIRFAFPGKTGQAQLFEKISVTHPKTFCFPSVAAFLEQNPSTALSYPIVFKLDWGGEGEGVHLIQDSIMLQEILEQAKVYEKTGQYGFVLQAFIRTGGRSLRVAVIGSDLYSYWRVSSEAEGFKSGFSSGGEIVHNEMPELQVTAREAVADFCRRTHIDLAGFDILFEDNDHGEGSGHPIFLEINYFFGRRGLGGSERFYALLQNAVDNWLRSFGLS